ncbi:unnamed protein product [Urochloa humidicola]
MGSRDGSSSNASRRLRLVSVACLALCLLLLSSCPPCEARKLLAADEEEGGKAMRFEGDLVLRVPPAPSTGTGGSSVVVARGFSASGRAARLMRSVPSPGVGH